jgi:cysteine synthase A
VSRTAGFPGVAATVAATIGRTPLVALERLGAGLPGLVLAKLESFSPGHSVKDRIALRMVEEAEREGHLLPGGHIVELTSGNTGIGLALVAAVRGYRFHAVMSAGNSMERRRILTALGADVRVVPQVDGSPGRVTGADLEAVQRHADALAKELGAWQPRQFENPANAAAHAETTAGEIWEQTGGRVDAWTAVVGTGGTYVGVARALRRLRPGIRCVAVEPAAARPLAGYPGTSPAHVIQGAGYNSVPPLWDGALCDGLLAVTDGDAVETARALAAREGILGGFSSGANVWAALQLAAAAAEGEVIVTLCPDTGLKYLSTDLYP